MVPDSWVSTTIGDIAELGSGATPSRRKQATYFDNGDTPWVKTGDLNNDVIYRTEESITAFALSDTTCKVYPVDTLLVAMYGGFKQIGRTGLLGCNAAINQALTAISLDTSRAIPKFVQHWLNGRVFHWKRLAGSSRKDPNITKSEVASFPILLPPICEQQSIIALLSTWDRGIRVASELSAVKRRVKQTMMQLLLTGKRRFPKFVKSTDTHHTAWGETPADWRMWPLSRITQESKRKNGEGVARVLTVSGLRGLVDQRDFFNRKVAGKSLDKYYLLRRGEFAYNRSLMKGYPYGATKRLDDYDSGVLSTLYLCFQLASNDCLSDFLVTVFESGLLNSQLRGIARMGARAHGLLNVTPDEFFDMVVPLPSLNEQRQIVGFIGTIGHEIDLLRKELELLKTQKRGLMQKLLTGQVRIKS